MKTLIISAAMLAMTGFCFDTHAAGGGSISCTAITGTPGIQTQLPGQGQPYTAAMIAHRFDGWVC
jgi:hypothetical protein